MQECRTGKKERQSLFESSLQSFASQFHRNKSVVYAIYKEQIINSHISCHDHSGHDKQYLKQSHLYARRSVRYGKCEYSGKNKSILI